MDNIYMFGRTALGYVLYYLHFIFYYSQALEYLVAKIPCKWRIFYEPLTYYILFLQKCLRNRDPSSSFARIFHDIPLRIQKTLPVVSRSKDINLKLIQQVWFCCSRYWQAKKNITVIKKSNYLIFRQRL